MKVEHETGLIRSSCNALRYMPFWVATGTLGILFILLIIGLVSGRQLVPQIVIIGSFILFVLYLTGLIKIAVEFFGPGGVNQSCQQYVQNQEFKGLSINTLAWLQQNNICALETPHHSLTRIFFGSS